MRCSKLKDLSTQIIFKYYKSWLILNLATLIKYFECAEFLIKFIRASALAGAHAEGNVKRRREKSERWSKERTPETTELQNEQVPQHVFSSYTTM